MKVFSQHDELLNTRLFGHDPLLLESFAASVDICSAVKSGETPCDSTGNYLHYFYAPRLCTSPPCHLCSPWGACRTLQMHRPPSTGKLDIIDLSSNLHVILQTRTQEVASTLSSMKVHFLWYMAVRFSCTLTKCLKNNMTTSQSLYFMPWGDNAAKTVFKCNQKIWNSEKVRFYQDQLLSKLDYSIIH